MTSPQSEPAGERRVTWLLLLAALLASMWLVRGAKRHAAQAPGRMDLIGAVPLGPELLVTVDVAGLGAAAAQELLRAGGSALLGLREQCGFEPLLGLRHVAFVVPFRAEPSQGGADFAVIAETSLDAEAVLRCAESVVRKRGGTPIRSSLGAFSSVRDQAKPLGEVAIRGDGLFVLSGGQYFRDVIDRAGGAAAGDERAKLRTELHLAVRRRLAPSQVVLTLLPGATLPLPGVEALGLGMEVKRGLELRGFVGCRSEPACVDTRELALRVRDELARDASVSGLASVSVVQHHEQLAIAGHLPREQLVAVLSQLITL